MSSFAQVDIRQVSDTISIECYELDSIDPCLMKVIANHLDSVKAHNYTVSKSEDIICLFISEYSKEESIKDESFRNFLVASYIVKIKNDGVYQLSNKINLANIYCYKYQNIIDTYIMISKDIPLKLNKTELHQKEYVVSYREYYYSSQGKIPFDFLGTPVDWYEFYYDTLFTIIPLTSFSNTFSSN